MNLWFLSSFLGVAFIGWLVVSYFFFRIERQDVWVKKQKTKMSQPAFRLSLQWLQESQVKMEQFLESHETKLSSIQGELLEIRLEIGRFAAGAKSLKQMQDWIKEHPVDFAPEQTLHAMVTQYIATSDFEIRDAQSVFLKTALGNLLCYEMKLSSQLEWDIKQSLISLQQARLLQPSTGIDGGILYVSKSEPFNQLVADLEQMQYLREQKILLVNASGMKTILLSLKISKQVDRLLTTGLEVVEKAQAILGQSDRLEKMLAELGSELLQVQAWLKNLEESSNATSISPGQHSKMTS
jgi:hypothetical protein